MFWTVLEQGGKLGVMQRGTKRRGFWENREKERERASLILMHKHTSELFSLEYLLIH